ncbi:MAG: hypothetical protein IRD3MM_03285 [Candidatus Midichloria mitochondrii]
MPLEEITGLARFAAKTPAKSYATQIARLDNESIVKLSYVAVSRAFEYLGSLKKTWIKLEPKYLVEGARHGKSSDWTNTKLSGESINLEPKDYSAGLVFIPTTV